MKPPIARLPRPSTRQPRAVCVGVACAVAALAPQTSAQTNPWANTVVAYTPGSNATPNYTDPNVALGQPTRFTGESGGFPGAVTPFNAPWENDEIVSIGEGGHLTVRFDQPVANDPNNPFGIDLLVFGNAWYIDTSWPNGVAGAIAAEGGQISVSADGQAWFDVVGVQADGAFPTLGYNDLTDPYATTRGNVLSGFTTPVDPRFDATGKSFAQITAAYNGSGGGTGIDIGLLGLSEISFVRITNPLGSGLTPEIDAFADVAPVPAPGVLALVASAALFSTRFRRERQGAARRSHPAQNQHVL
jgi:hypothetical protein